jgi:lipopolysaccharide transport system permease protein
MDARHLAAIDAWDGIHVCDLLYVLVGRDIKLRYRGSVLGVLWSLLNPLAHLVVLVFVFQWVTPLNIPNYPLFVFTGVLAWSWFSAALPAATISITSNRQLIRQPGFPAAILPAVPVLSSLVHFAIAMALVLVVLVISGGWLTPAVLALPLVVGLQFLVTLSLGFVTATVQVRFRDTAYLLAMLLLLGFFLTPVFYRPSLVPTAYQFVYVLNPMAHLIGAYRDILIGGQWPDAAGLLAVGTAATALLWLGHRMFNRASVSFAEET